MFVAGWVGGVLVALDGSGGPLGGVGRGVGG